jgi:hypothetical protein
MDASNPDKPVLNYATPAFEHGYAPPNPRRPWAAVVHPVLLQISHRAIALAIWVLAARLALVFWDRRFGFGDHLLPGAFGLLVLGATSALVVLWTSREMMQTRAESRGLTIAAIAMMILTLVALPFAQPHAWPFR